MVFRESVEYNFRSSKIVVSEEEHQMITAVFSSYPFLRFIQYRKIDDETDCIDVTDKRTCAGAKVFDPEDLSRAVRAVECIAHNRYGFNRYRIKLVDHKGDVLFATRVPAMSAMSATFDGCVEYSFGSKAIALTGAERRKNIDVIQTYEFVGSFAYGSLADSTDSIRVQEAMARNRDRTMTADSLPVAISAVMAIASSRYGPWGYWATITSNDGDLLFDSRHPEIGLKDVRQPPDVGDILKAIGCRAGSKIAKSTSPVVDFTGVTAETLRAKRPDPVVHLPLVLEAISRANDEGLSVFNLHPNVLYSSIVPNRASHTFTDDELEEAIVPALKARKFKIGFDCEKNSACYRVTW